LVSLHVYIDRLARYGAWYCTLLRVYNMLCFLFFSSPNFCAEVEMRTVKLKIFFLVRKYIKQPEEEEPPQKLLKKQKSQHQHAAKT